MPVMMRFQVPSRAQSLNHKPIPQVNSLASKLIDGKREQRLFGRQGQSVYRRSGTKGTIGIGSLEVIVCFSPGAEVRLNLENVQPSGFA
jgi:hypothetical protein